MKQKNNSLLLGVAEKLIEELRKEGIESYIWHKATTGSVYIRFNDPRMNSIRIANHPGRSHLKYKFNLRSDLGLSKLQWKKEDGKWRCFIPLEKWKELVPILKGRALEVSKMEEPPRYGYGVPSFKLK